MKLHFKNLATMAVVALLVATGCSPKEIVDPDPLTIEFLRSLSEEQLRARDSDGDRLSDYDEMFVHNTNPLSADTDDDGLGDYAELMEHETDPNNPDTDGDGLNDGAEVLTHGTDPKNPDSDGDGLSDGDEINRYRTNPLSTDSDGDGLSDYDEVNTHNSNPNNPDTDGDGFTDGQEIEMGTDPNDSSDPAFIQELATVNFDFDRSNVDAAAATILAGNVEMLRNAPNFKIRVDAYTDHIGGDQYNLRLSVRRANAVRSFYVDNGISEDRIEVNGRGKAPNPCVVMDTNGKGCRADRRAESTPINPYPFTPRRN